MRSRSAMPYISAATFVSYRILACIHSLHLTFYNSHRHSASHPFPHSASPSSTNLTFQTSSTQMYNPNHFAFTPLKKYFPHILKQYCESLKSLIVTGSSYNVPETPVIPFPMWYTSLCDMTESSGQSYPPSRLTGFHAREHVVRLT